MILVMYVRMVAHIARVWINRIRLPILLVVSSTGKNNISLSPFAPENLVSRDGLGSPVPRQPAHLHTQAESGAYLRDSSRVPRRRPFIYLNLHTLSGHAIAYRWRSLQRVRRHRDSSPQGSSSDGCCLYRYHLGPINVRLSFPTPTILLMACINSGHVQSIGGCIDTSITSNHIFARALVCCLRYDNIYFDAIADLGRFIRVLSDYIHFPMICTILQGQRW